MDTIESLREEISELHMQISILENKFYNHELAMRDVLSKSDSRRLDIIHLERENMRLRASLNGNDA